MVSIGTNDYAMSHLYRMWSWFLSKRRTNDLCNHFSIFWRTPS